MNNMYYYKLNVPLLSDSQKPKNCKKQTPNYQASFMKNDELVEQIGFVKGNVVYCDGKCLVNGTRLNGEYIFDSYDNYDNTCFIFDKTNPHLTFNVLLKEINLL